MPNKKNQLNLMPTVKKTRFLNCYFSTIS